MSLIEDARAYIAANPHEPVLPRPGRQRESRSELVSNVKQAISSGATRGEAFIRVGTTAQTYLSYLAMHRILERIESDIGPIELRCKREEITVRDYFQWAQ